MSRDSLVEKYNERHEGVDYFYTTCHNNGCWDATCLIKCGIKDGKVVSIEPDDSVNAGIAREDDDENAVQTGMLQARACPMGHAWRQELYSENRLLYPMKRVGEKGSGRGHFERISWDEALDTIAEKMRVMAKENEMSNRFCRTEIMLGADAMERLKNASVAVFGVGGVGGFAAEGIVRSGIGSITLVDDDVVAESNLNRQIIALTSTIGRPKVSLMAARARDINPDVMIDERIMRYDESTAESFDFTKYDYIVDAIDSVTSKLILIERAKAAGVPIISCMGAGNKLDPTAFQVADISETSVCPLARVVRRELKKRGIVRGVKVVYSKEPVIFPEDGSEKILPGKHRTTGSIAFVPSVAGMIIAGTVVKDIAGV